MGRRGQILIAFTLLMGCSIYAYVRTPEILDLAFREEGGQITCNGCKVLDVRENAFSVRWRNGQPKKFVVDRAPPFELNDAVAFSLRVNGENFRIEEYHVLEPQLFWYAKLLISIAPFFLVIGLFLREFRPVIRDLRFERRASKDA